MEKLLLIDGNSIMNRAYYGVPDLTNVNGVHTNAVYGFLNILFRFLDEEKPDYLAIAFDLHAPTFRHKLFDAYKGTRKGMPDELREQVPYIKNLVKELNIHTLELEGYEADDLLGTVAKKGQSEGMEVTLLSGDRDLLQISDEHIKIRIPKTVKGQTTVEDYYPDDVVKKYNVTPEEFIHMKALMGDSSDNIPGVPKVGEKTAGELIVKYHNLDNIYASLDEISKDSIRNSLKENKELAYLCLKLATIEINAPISFEFSQLKNEITFTQGGYDIVKELGLRTYLKRFEDNMSSKKNEINVKELNIVSVSDVNELNKYFDDFKNDRPVSYVSNSFGSVLGNGDMFVFVPVTLSAADVIRKCIFENNTKVIVFRSSEVFGFLNDEDFKKNSHDLTANVFAVDLAAYLLNPVNNDYSPESLLNDYTDLSFNVNSFEKEDLAGIAFGYIKLYEIFDEKLKESGQFELFENIEMPLSLVLYEMEKTGILVDKKGLADYENRLSVSITDIEKRIYEEAGEQFNILSPKQLGVILFEKMNLPNAKKTKTGYSTSADVLEKLAPDYPFVANILEYRALTKLKSTYAVGLTQAIGEDGRIHSHFLQTVTATGRISSAEPNLQNIPVRTEIGRQLRKVFIPKEGYIFADADYSQIELRILAHMSKDKTLTDAFNSGQDIHSVTASKVFNVPVDQVTSSQRRAAKVVNFGIIYGMSSFSLGQDLEITRKDAEKYIKEYFEGYPDIKNYLEGCVDSAKETGYSITEFNRRRPIPELKSSQFMQREFGKRVAMNAPIQGTAADIMKIAMINVRDALVSKGLSSRILIQVHDELLLEVKESEREEAVSVLKNEMENAYKMNVMLTVECNTGSDWYEAK